MALTTPKPGTRPTTDRTKEAIFSHLDSWGVLDDARVLDLFAGTGALGIEALSRGARELVAVESAAPAAALIAKTLTALKHNRSWEPGMSARVVKARAEKYAAAASAIAPFGVIFIDLIDIDAKDCMMLKPAVCVRNRGVQPAAGRFGGP